MDTVLFSVRRRMKRRIELNERKKILVDAINEGLEKLDDIDDLRYILAIVESMEIDSSSD